MVSKAMQNKCPIFAWYQNKQRIASAPEYIPAEQEAQDVVDCAYEPAWHDVQPVLPVLV